MAHQAAIQSQQKRKLSQEKYTLLLRQLGE